MYWRMVEREIKRNKEKMIEKETKKIIVCSNCGLTKREHKSMLFLGRNGKYCHSFKKEITLEKYKELEHK